MEPKNSTSWLTPTLPTIPCSQYAHISRFDKSTCDIVRVPLQSVNVSLLISVKITSAPLHH